MLTENEKVIFSSLGECIENNKEDFVELLRESGVTASMTNDTSKLVDLYLDNVGANPALMLGSAYLCAFHSTNVSFDGEKGVDNNTVHSIGRTLHSYFAEDASNFDWNKVRDIAGGFKSGGWAGGIGAATQSIGDAVDRRNNPQKYMPAPKPLSTAGMDMLRAKQDARNQMIQSALAMQKAKADAAVKIAEEKRKQKKTTYIAVGIGVGVLILTGVGIWLYRRSKNN